jgi:hypothetical protein
VRTQVMQVSPRVFAKIQEKAAEGAVARMIAPNEYDRFALWAHETFGCVYYTEYKVEVVWEWCNLWKWAFPQVRSETQ